jgi:hypothetical protein
MRVRTQLLAVTVGGLVLPATVAPMPVSAEPLPTGTVQGTARDADDPADPAAPGLQARLYRWDGSAFVPDTDHQPTSTGPNGGYAFSEVADGFYTVRFSDTSFTYVPTTWPSTTGQMPTTNATAEGSGVVEVTAAGGVGSQASSAFPEPPQLDVTVLKQLSNEGVAPDVTGLRRFGYPLSATPGGWNPDASTLTFAWQWQRVDSQGNARDIPGATGPTYVLTAAEVGQGIRVRATGQRAGYASESGYSDETEVRRAYSATVVRLAYRRIHATSRGRIRVTVTPSTAPPTGTVTVKVDGRRRLATTLKPTQAGSVALLLPRLGRGTHRVVAVYGGSSGLYGSTSRATALTVVR